MSFEVLHSWFNVFFFFFLSEKAMWACGCVLLSSYYAELTLLSALFVPLMINFGIKAISRHLVIVLIWEFSCWTKKAPQTVTVLLRSGGKYFVSKKGQQPLFLSFLSVSWVPTTCRVLYFLRATTSKTLFCPSSWQNLLATFQSHAGSFFSCPPWVSRMSETCYQGNDCYSLQKPQYRIQCLLSTLRDFQLCLC